MMPRQELASFQEQVSWGPQRYCSDSTSHAVIAEATILAGKLLHHYLTSESGNKPAFSRDVASQVAIAILS